MATIEIDGKTYEAEPGTMLIKVTDANGIDIPRFCYHKKLSVAANCRMCLVEVEKAPKPMPACATPIMDGMKVYTRSTRALLAQKAVMEFLLINHPLDCPICDQGGECELQDIAVGYGGDVSHYQEGKRVVADKNLGPLVATEMTRCIHCTRCVRFSDEIAGMMELGATGRGEHTKIGTYIAKTVDSELSGNIVDLCPVGALTNKVFRFSARAWEMQQYNGIAPHDGIGSHVHLHVRRDEVMRVVPKENEAINEMWLSDRDRYGYTGLKADDRLTTPMIKKDGQWHETDWETALSVAVDGLKKVIKTHQSKAIGALASPTATLEELYLLQKLLRGIGSHNIDHRLRQSDFSQQDTAPLYPALGQTISELETAQAVLVIGSHIRKEQPLLNHRLRKASLRGGKIMFVNPIRYNFNYPVAAELITPPAQLVATLAGIAKALLLKQPVTIPDGVDSLLTSVTPDTSQQQIADILLAGEQSTILLGSLATAHPLYATVCALANAIAQMSSSKLGYLAESANTVGAWLAGALPHRSVAGEVLKTSGLDAQAMLTSGVKGYVLLGVEPELDSIWGTTALQTLKQADFVVSVTAYCTPAIESYAHVVLPMSLYAETSGTFVNTEGKWQSFTGAIKPCGDIRPAWKILRVLGNLFNLAGFDYVSSDEVRDEVSQLIGDKSVVTIVNNMLPAQLPTTTVINGLQRITELPIYAVDALVRRAKALQETIDGKTTNGIHLNAVTANKQGLSKASQVKVKQDEVTIQLTLVIDERVPDDCALIYAGQATTAVLGTWHGGLKLSVA
ncbi:NADH-quinone oxidoreductase subunit NuoG [Beggiatoa leptomitoformis]|uniref:NADH-quinone oxidoreductase n=1 Tax=Beggiatoa leptomitoformis TaxID=288004 RepID=A0A2N9YHA6_9GAMM|nr:NADH-quinone oxidoreductase subunit NuoG [Beggiatoa leptomitoformis]ALG67831.1 NADH-quinone oxidoreductase subunit G [Beggiatoa leptomitoformis]AUI69912.1 NADH-quinone oxidoreductase subunit G [Beggiatoa leptomitoformis]